MRSLCASSSDNDGFHSTILNVPFKRKEIKRFSRGPSENVIQGALFQIGV